MSKLFLEKTAKVSFGLQIITGLIDYFALQFEIPPELYILKQLLFLELCVQIIEGIFYYWLITSFNTISNITVFRYYDWMLTTPTMLITLMMYLSHLDPSNKNKNLQDLIKENKGTVLSVISLNFLMLYYGYLGETGKMKIKDSVYAGFIPFLMYYKIIYDKFIVKIKDNKEGLILYWYFFIFWGLYGVAALFPYNLKNVSYNILDLFSKNFFGIFLSYTVYKNRI